MVDELVKLMANIEAAEEEIRSLHTRMNAGQGNLADDRSALEKAMSRASQAKERAAKILSRLTQEG